MGPRCKYPEGPPRERPATEGERRASLVRVLGHLPEGYRKHLKSGIGGTTRQRARAMVRGMTRPKGGKRAK